MIPDTVPETGDFFNFGIHSIQFDSVFALAFLDKEKRLAFYNLDSKRITVSIDLNPFLKGVQMYSAKIFKHKLFILNLENKCMAEFDIYDTTTTVFKKLYKLESILDWNKYYIRFSNDNTFDVILPNFYLAYGIKNSSTYWLDTTAYIKLNLDSPGDNFTLEKVFKFPKEYLKGGHYRPEGFVRPLGNVAVAGFASDNTLYTTESPLNKITTKTIENVSDFRKLDQEKLSNLAYIKWFCLTDEYNANALTLANGDLLIIKMLRKKEIKDVSTFEYYVFDHNLQVKFHNTFLHEIDPIFTYCYKKGFVIFNRNQDKAYYYEAPY